MRILILFFSLAMSLAACSKMVFLDISTYRGLINIEFFSDKSKKNSITLCVWEIVILDSEDNIEVLAYENIKDCVPIRSFQLSNRSDKFKIRGKYENLVEGGEYIVSVYANGASGKSSFVMPHWVGPNHGIQ